MSEQALPANWRNEMPEQWSNRVAALAVDALIYPGIVKREDVEKAIAIVGEEIYARLCVRDYPPPMESPSNDT
jgi:hypothetical protein